MVAQATACIRDRTEPAELTHSAHLKAVKEMPDQVTRFQSAVTPSFHGAGVGVVEGTLQVGSGLALRIVHKYEAIFLIETELVGPAPGVIGAAVSAPGGCGSAGGRPGPMAGAAGLAGDVLGLLADAWLLCFGVTAVLVLGFLP